MKPKSDFEAMIGFYVAVIIYGVVLALSGVIIYPQLAEAWLVWPLIIVLTTGWVIPCVTVVALARKIYQPPSGAARS